MPDAGREGRAKKSRRDQSGTQTPSQRDGGGQAGDKGAAASGTDITVSGGGFSGSEVADFIAIIDPGVDANRLR